MPIEITVPRLGWSMDEGTFAEWLKKDGEEVRAGDMLFVLEGDKAAQEVECFDSGRLKLLPTSPKPGDIVKVGQILAHLLTPSDLAAVSAAPAPQATPSPPAAVSDSHSQAAGSAAAGSDSTSDVAAGPAVRRLARELQVDLNLVSGTGPSGRILDEDVQRAAQQSSNISQSDRPVSSASLEASKEFRAETVSGVTPSPGFTGPFIKASPRARRTAEALGVDWSQITPSGRGGRVSERDVLRATGRSVPERPKVSVAAVPVPAAPVPEVPVAVEPKGVSVAANAMTPEQPVSEVLSSSTTPVPSTPTVPVPVFQSPVASTPDKQPASVPAQEFRTAPEVKIAPATGALLLRRTIAQRMMESHLTTAPVTLTTSVDVTNLVNLREQFRAMSGNSTLPVPGYAEFIIRLAALALREHPQINARWEADSVRVLSEIHIGIAVDTDSGLVVPVIRNVDQLSLRRVTQESRQLIEKARSRRLSAPEMQDGTFTVTNLGALGIDAFTPIINLPQCAVLGMGRIVRQPVFQEQQIVPRDMMTLSLTFDHRIVDGAPAARFLQSLSKSIEHPAQFLID